MQFLFRSSERNVRMYVWNLGRYHCTISSKYSFLPLHFRDERY